jgi:CHAT domain-containing protein
LADETTFKKLAGKKRVLHIAAHTIVDENKPSLSGIVMNSPEDSLNDGDLYAFELAQMKLNAQLVVLSGCNTGFGTLRKNEGLISISRSFFYTGVRTVAFTLWSIADGSGAKITTEFYRLLRKRNRLDEALRTSKLNFLEQAEPVKAHPFYWSGYLVVGKTDAVIFNQSRLWLNLGIITLLIILLSVWFYRKFRN